MANFGIFKGFSDKLFEGELPTQLGTIGSKIAQSYLLDSFPNAAAAYSLRLLRINYTGFAIRVRRSSDNTEQDIGFIGNNLNTSALTSFCGAGNGFVTTWYDQSGNARNATQTTAASQPQIVSSGNIILENTKPAIQFDGSNDNLSINSFSNTTSNSIFVVENRNRQLTGTTDFAFSFVRDRIYYDKNTYFQMTSNSGNYLINSMINTTNLQELLSLFYSNNGAIYKNNNIQSSSLSFNPFNNSSNSTIGSADTNNLFAQVKHQELIYYTSDQSSNRTGIEFNINTYYGIY